MRFRTRGQSLVEFALVMFFIIIPVIFGIIDFSYYVYTYSELENATRRASEFASKVAPNNVTCKQLAEDEAKQNLFLADQSKVNIMFPSYTRKTGEQIQVQLTYTGTYLTPVARQMFGSTFQFKFTSQRTILGLGPYLSFDSSTNSFTEISCK